MKFLTSLAFASLALAMPSLVVRDRPSSLDIQIQVVNNTRILAFLTNNGETGIRLLKTGTFLDKAPVNKAKVYSVDTTEPARFKGISINIFRGNFTPSSFYILNAGRSVSAVFDLANLYELSADSTYYVELSGSLPITSLSNDILSFIPYQSNRLTVHSTAIGKVARDSHLERRLNTFSCHGSNVDVADTALDNCQRLAKAAAKSALDVKDNRIHNYFPNIASNTRSEVASVFNKVAAECGAKSGGSVNFYCTDDLFSFCRPEDSAFTSPKFNIVVACPNFYKLPALPSQCHSDDQATTLIHEMTHAEAVKGTKDYGLYGIDGTKTIMLVSPHKSITHADSYAMFANSVYLNC